MGYLGQIGLLIATLEPDAPASGRSRPHNIAIRLDLPAPLRPVSAIASPRTEIEAQALEDQPAATAASEILGAKA